MGPRENRFRQFWKPSPVRAALLSARACFACRVAGGSWLCRQGRIVATLGPWRELFLPKLISHIHASDIPNASVSWLGRDGPRFSLHRRVRALRAVCAVSAGLRSRCGAHRSLSSPPACSCMSPAPHTRQARAIRNPNLPPVNDERVSAESHTSRIVPLVCNTRASLSPQHTRRPTILA